MEQLQNVKRVRGADRMEKGQLFVSTNLVVVAEAAKAAELDLMTSYQGTQRRHECKCRRRRRWRLAVGVG